VRRGLERPWVCPKNHRKTKGNIQVNKSYLEKMNLRTKMSEIKSQMIKISPVGSWGGEKRPRLQETSFFRREEQANNRKLGGRQNDR